MKRLRVAGAIAASLSLAGCDLIFKLDGAAPSDAAGVVDAPPRPVACTTPARAFTDDFNDNNTLPIWRLRANGNQITETNSLMQIDMSQTQTSADARMPTFLDLRGSSVSINAGALATFGTGTVQTLELEALDFDRANSRGHSLRISHDNDRLVVDYTVDGTPFPVINIPFLTTAHAFWRIAQDGPTTRWSTSPDGNTFTEVTDQDFPFAIDFVKPRLAVAIDMQTLTATFDQLNGGGSPTVAICPANELVDDFQILDRVVWGRITEINCTPQIADGRLAFGGVGQLACHLGSSGPYDLVNHSFTVDVASVLTGSCRTRVEVEALDGTIAAFQQDSGMLKAVSQQVGMSQTTHASVPYDVAVQRYWRFVVEADAGGQELTWQTSSDNVTFTNLIKVPGFAELNRAQFLFLLDSQPGDGVCNASFDSVNL